jgi:hypothetical protein
LLRQLVAKVLSYRFFGFATNFSSSRRVVERLIAWEFSVIFDGPKDPSVHFEAGVDAVLVGIDGTWRRDCMLVDISATGARLVIRQSMAGLNAKEFFLVLTPSGSTFRRCALTRIDGDELGVRFFAPAAKSSRRKPAPPPGR